MVCYAQHNGDLMATAEERCVNNSIFSFNRKIITANIIDIYKCMNSKYGLWARLISFCSEMEKSEPESVSMTKAAEKIIIIIPCMYISIVMVNLKFSHATEK